MRLGPRLILALITSWTAQASEPDAPPADDRLGVRWGLLPMLSASSDRGLTLGVITRRFDYGDPAQRPFKSLLTMQVRRMSKGPRDAYIAWESIEPARRLRLDLWVSASLYERYHGIGDDTPRDSTLVSQRYYDYSQTHGSLSASIRWPLLPEHQIDWQPGLTLVGRQSEPNSPSTLYAADYGTAARTDAYGKLHLAFVRDLRDSEFGPSQGSYLSLEGQYSPGPISNLADWRRLDIDYRRFDSFIDRRWLWLATQLRYTSSSADAPLEEKARLGSLGTIRGLPLFRYASNHVAVARTELRSMWFRTRVFSKPYKAGTGAFIDTARVGDTLSRLSSGTTHIAWGLTFFFSIFTDDFIANADIGFSRGDAAYYIRMGHAF